MDEKFNFFHNRVMDPRTPGATDAPAPPVVSNNNNDNNGNEESADKKFPLDRRSIIGIAVLMCFAGAFTIDWSGSSSRKRSGQAYEDSAEPTVDPEYLKIKGRNAEQARSGRGLLFSIFCRGNQRSDYCAKH